MTDLTATSTPSAAELAAYSLAGQHRLTRRWCDDRSRLVRLTEQHEFDVRLATDEELAGARAERMAVGQPPAAFLNRWVAVVPAPHDRLEGMFSIRFEGGAPDRPFVDATVLSRPLASGDLIPLAEAALRLFGAFDPAYLRLWSAEPVDAFHGCARDRRFLAAPVGDITESEPAGDRLGELQLLPAANLAHLADARAAYAAVDRSHPVHRGQAQLQDADDLNESVAAGTLFDVLIDGRWAGWVSTVPSESPDTLGLPAHVVQELILTPGYRGRGRGAQLNRLLAEQLRARHGPDVLLIGTIHADNRGAILAARAAGRRDIGGWIRYPLGAP